MFSLATKEDIPQLKKIWTACFGDEDVYKRQVPIIQPPIMKLLTTKKERSVVMEQLRPVSKLEKIVFPILVTLLVSFIVPDAAPLIGMLMLGNLMRESGVVSRLSNTAQNELMNIVTIFLGISVGATATADRFLTQKTLGIVLLGLIAFCLGTAAGVLFGKLMYILDVYKRQLLCGTYFEEDIIRRPFWPE